MIWDDMIKLFKVNIVAHFTGCPHDSSSLHTGYPFILGGSHW